MMTGKSSAWIHSGKRESEIHPKSKANIFSLVSFWWVVPMIKLGNKRALGEKDLYKIPTEDESEVLGKKLHREWMKEVVKCGNLKKRKRPSLVNAFLSMFGKRYMLLGLQAFVEECIIKIGQPLCLGQLISSFNPESTIPLEHAYLYATGVVFGAIYNTLYNSLAFNCQYIGMQARVATSSLIFQKSLKLSQKSLCHTTIGQMLNLVSNDVNRFDQLFVYLNYLWVGPLQIIITTIVLYYKIGMASLVGLLVLFILAPLFRVIGHFYSLLRNQVAPLTDERIRIVNEIIPGMRVIKMYAWEKPFLKMTELCRKMEMAVVRRTGILRAFNVTLLYIASKLMIFPTLVAYVLLGNELTPEKVFLIVALFNNTRVSMPGHFSAAIQTAAEGNVSIKRIEDFLLLNEMFDNHEEDPQSHKLNKLRGKIANVEFKKVSVKWPAVSAEFDENTLTGISFRVRQGQSLAVVGQVGAGKTTLLNAILGELPVLSGNSVVEGKIAYASQEYWIVTGSIRQNILCGAEMDLERYQQVIQAASLVQDFAQLPQGDSSIIGEGGVSLSGGQKARVNLARCLYVDADIYLLDDPLSAVDTRVSAHLVHNAINGFLKGKIRILVTHQLQYLKEFDQILVLKGGKMDSIGTFSELQSKGLDLTKIVHDEEEIDEEDEVEEDIQVPWPTITNKRLASIKNMELHQTAGWCASDVSSNARRQTIAKYARRQTRRRTTSSSNSKRIKSMHESNRIKAKRSLMVHHVEKDPAHDATEQVPTTTAPGVGAGTYWKYLHSGGGVFQLIFFTISCLFTEALFCASDYWLNLWTAAERTRNSNATLNSSRISTYDEEMMNTTSLTKDTWVLDTTTGIYVYSILIGCVFIFGFLRALQFFFICSTASVKLYDTMFQAVIHAPVQFFDKNPVGRIVNRFTKDTGSMDDQLPAVFFDPIYIGLNTLGAVIMVSVVKYWLIIPAILLSVVFYVIRRIYMKAAAGIKRLESSTKSPVFTQLYSSLIGLTTLRAHKCQASFQRDFNRFQDVHSSTWILFLGTARWLGFWMDWVVAAYIASVTYACVIFRESLTSSEVGLIISAAMSMARFQFGIRQSAEMENQMVSVSNIIDYGQLEPEAPLETENDYKPPKDWPSSGIVQFDDMSLRYSPNDSPVLKNLTFTIGSTEKIGIVGRSGAGKSSVIAALFRLTEPEGKILIDGIDSKQFALFDLRSNLAIIPQEPIMFSGSLRSNLDPFEKVADEELWSAIKEVHLDTFIDVGSTSRSLLDFVISEGGANLSVGQRQLICLARAILRNNKILVLDEATASVDQETDIFIQLIIREKFKDCTVLTIAHRLNTIMDSDKILVLDAGRLSEFDEPIQLLSNPSGIFHSLVEQTGHHAASELVNLAKQASELRQLRSFSTMLENIEESERYGSEEKLLESDTASADDDAVYEK